MFSRFSPANQQLREATAEHRYGPLKTFEIENRTALLWPGYDLTLAALALDMMHADFDLVTALLGQPETVHVAGLDGPDGHGSATTVVLVYPAAFARLSGSALMPQPYGVRGGWRATFTDGLLEYAMSAGFTGQGPATLTEHTSKGERPLELSSTSPYDAMIDHVLACLTGDAENSSSPPAHYRHLNSPSRCTSSSTNRSTEATANATDRNMGPATSVTKDAEPSVRPATATPSNA